MSFYSGISDFNSRDPYSAFWQTGSWSDPDHIVVCGTNGWMFMGLLQPLLRSVPEGQTYDGTTVSGAMIQVDRRFGPITAKVLWLAAKNAGAGPATLAQMQREAVARDLSGRYLLTAGILLVVSAANRTPFVIPEGDVGIRLPAGNGLIPPRWGIEPPRPVGWVSGPPEGMPAINCTQPYLPEAVIPDNPPPAPSPGVPPPPPPPEQGGPPIPVPPPGPIDLPPGVTVRPVVEPGGVSWGVIGVTAAGVIVLSWLGLSLMKAPTKPSTQLRRPSRRRFATATA